MTTIIKEDNFIFDLKEVEFITWSHNHDDGRWFIKFHLPSGKECRVKVDEKDEVDEIIEKWNAIKNGDYDELDH